MKTITLFFLTATSLAQAEMYFYDESPYGVGGRDCAIYIAATTGCHECRSSSSSELQGDAVAVDEFLETFQTKCAVGVQQVPRSTRAWVTLGGDPDPYQYYCRLPLKRGGTYRLRAFWNDYSTNVTEITVPDCVEK